MPERYIFGQGEGWGLRLSSAAGSGVGVYFFHLSTMFLSLWLLIIG